METQAGSLHFYLTRSHGLCCVHTLPYLKPTEAPREGSEKSLAALCWHSQSPSHAARPLVQEQHLPLHSILPTKFVFPEFPCSQVLRSTPARWEECPAALLERKCSKTWMMPGFVNVGSCCDLCTQMPKQMVQGCSHRAGEAAATDTDNHIPGC